MGVYELRVLRLWAIELGLLAPVVVERKGEHVQLMQDLMAQGFIRARINGEVYELDDPPALDLRRKHNIEAVVDRFKVKDDLKLRLAESFETALRLADGTAGGALPGRRNIFVSARGSSAVQMCSARVIASANSRAV